MATSHRISQTERSAHLCGADNTSPANAQNLNTIH
jgi:hypothetical protein